MKPAICFSMST